MAVTSIVGPGQSSESPGPGRGAGAQPGQPALSIESVSMRFGDVLAVSDVSLDLIAGQVHGLIGANGSGKSTLVKIISGVLNPTSGSIGVDGESRAGLGSPAEAARLGVRVIHQEAPLIDTMTVLESVAIFRGYERRRWGQIDWRALRREIGRLLEQMDVPVALNQLCAQVSPADRAGLALAIALGDEAEAAEPVRLLIVDEVTAAIPDRDTARHLERLRLVAERGVAVVMVTHRLAELEIADDTTILRAGSVVYRQGSSVRRPVAELVEEMASGATSAELVGHGGQPARSTPVQKLWSVAPPARSLEHSASRTGAEPVLSLQNVTGDELRGVSFEARPGEVVGFAGLPHAGITELPLVLAGAVQRTGGSLRVGDREIARAATPVDMIEAGLAVVPSDRLRAGGVASLSVDENVVLPALKQYWHKRARRRSVVEGVIDAFDVRPRNGKAALGALSGGNQQKVLIGKWLALRPAVLCLDDPTYGVDPGARETIFDAILDAAALGVCVLFFSTEPEQLVRVCTRVLVIGEGVIERELSGAELTLQTLTEWNYR